MSTVADSRRATALYRGAARLGIQAAEALQHAHDQGVLHRDIKPSNLLLDGEGKLYITDFGLARIEADAGLTMTGDIIGTLRYMAPEQALAKRVVPDQRADVDFSGATLYELLALQPAFNETDRSELIKQIAFEEPRPLRKIDRQIPADLETIVLKAMAKRRDDRYHSAQELADDLQRFLDHKPILAKPPTLLNRVAKWSRRHVAIVWAAAAVLMVSALGFAVSTAIISRERQEAMQQKVRAEANFEHAHQILTKYFTAVDQNEILAVPGLNSLRQQLMEDALNPYKGFVELRKEDPILQAELAATYFRLAWISMSMKLDDKERSMLIEGLGIVDRLFDSKRSNDISWHTRLAGVFSSDRFFHKCAIGNPLSARGAISTLETVAARWEKLIELNPKNTAFKTDMARLCSVLGDAHSCTGEELAESLPSRAMPFYERAHELWENLIQMNPERLNYQESLAASKGDLLVLLIRSGRLSEADELIEAIEQRNPLHITAKATKTVLNPGNGHYYEFVADDGVSWMDARSAADSRTFVAPSGNVLRGYLATITSEEEQKFLAVKFGEYGTERICHDVWLGGSDAGEEGFWRWVTGPEASAEAGKGQLFWVGATSGAPRGYKNWIPNLEPNDIKWSFTDTGEDYLAWNHRPENHPALHYWNDSDNFRAQEPASGYFVEYGGLGALVTNAQLKAIASTLNCLAWGLATTPDENIRDGKSAVELATKACVLSDYKNAVILDTLAAAYAETADFESAIKWQEKTVEMAPGAEWATRHLNAFRNGKPWREGPNSAGQ